MALGKINIGGTEFTFVFRHRFEKARSEAEDFDNHFQWHDWKLGLWFKRNKVVGIKNFYKPDQWRKNLANQYMFGINLLICKAWLAICRNGMNIPE